MGSEHSVEFLGRVRVRFLAALLSLSVATAASAVDFVEFESGPVKTVATNAAGTELYAANIPDGRVEIFDVTDSGLIQTASVPVGLEPVTVAVAPDGRVWVSSPAILSCTFWPVTRS